MTQRAGVPINGGTLKLLRELRGLTSEDLAARTGIPDNTIRQYETGRARPSEPRLQKLCEELRVPQRALDCTPLVVSIVQRATAIALGQDPSRSAHLFEEHEGSAA